MKKLTGFLTIILTATTLTASALTNAWQWQSAPLPRAYVIEGMWSDFFQIVPALHSAGLRYTCVSLNELPATDAELPKDSVIVLANVAAPHLKPARVARIQEFVAAGGGLVVLAGRSAYCQGAYANTPLAEMLPVTFDFYDTVPQGVPLTRASSATWLPALDVSAKPMAYYLQTFKPKPDAVVQLLAGNQPTIVSGTFGKGRVVAVGLTVNGNPPPGAVPFWEWSDWPRLFGQTIEWAAGARPLQMNGEVGQSPASQLKPLSTDELNDYALGLKTPENLLARAVAQPRVEVAEALFAHLTAPDATGKLTLAQALPVLVPFAKPDWGPRLTERTEALNPSREDRVAALVLLGATRWTNAAPHLLPALAKPETKPAAIEGLGYTGDPRAIAPLRQAYAAAIRAALVDGETEYFNPDEFAREYAALATESALALYRLGDPEGIARVLTIQRHVKLYWRILGVASRRELRNWNDPIALAALHNICDLASRLDLYAWQKLRRHAAPMPASQLAAFVKVAQTATDPTDVIWLAEELEASLAAFPPVTWQPLVSAKDGIIARIARGAVATTPTTHP